LCFVVFIYFIRISSNFEIQSFFFCRKYVLHYRTFLQTFQSGFSLSLRLSPFSVIFVVLSTLALVWCSQVEGSDFSFLKFIGSVIRRIEVYCSVSTSSVCWTNFFFSLGQGDGLKFLWC
jgi:hypothetical protein